MANEKRLIDANALLDRMSVVTNDTTCPLHIAACIDQEIELAPTVDAVEVVRCKDCKQWSRNSGIAESPNGHCFYHDIDTNGYDFCSYGERRNAHA